MIVTSSVLEYREMLDDNVSNDVEFSQCLSHPFPADSTVVCA